ncbi:hypothetical protein B0H12DRAFT_1087447 [Mycena haematopus]|nr:hypothetical protein B0H12DRAFT_1087447 [Mycena haematopus]
MLFRCYFALLSVIAVASVAALPLVEPELAVRDSSSDRDWRRDSSSDRDWRRDSSSDRDWRRDSSSDRDWRRDGLRFAISCLPLNLAQYSVCSNLD